ncbi:hypothetical protein [Vibrio splendidus]|uniref:hypothetical protein n=1 Tax=Vibrio splendidus TaxID=29497 RepID=UPI003D12AF18
MKKFTHISGSGCFVAKAKIASMANEYAKNHDVVGGKDTIVGTWVNSSNLVEDKDKEQCKKEILSLCGVMEEQKVTSINRFAYHELVAKDVGTSLLDVGSRLMDDIKGTFSESNKPQDNNT